MELGVILKLKILSQRKYNMINLENLVVIR